MNLFISLPSMVRALSSFRFNPRSVCGLGWNRARRPKRVPIGIVWMRTANMDTRRVPRILSPTGHDSNLGSTLAIDSRWTVIPTGRLLNNDLNDTSLVSPVPYRGNRQVLAGLGPIFQPAHEESPLTGAVGLSAGQNFPWVFTEDARGGYTISVPQSSIPNDVSFPAGGKLFLVWEGAAVKWQWLGGIVAPEIPVNAVWTLKEVESSD